MCTSTQNTMKVKWIRYSSVRAVMKRMRVLLYMILQTEILINIHLKTNSCSTNNKFANAGNKGFHVKGVCDESVDEELAK